MTITESTSLVASSSELAAMLERTQRRLFLISLVAIGKIYFMISIRSFYKKSFTSLSFTAIRFPIILTHKSMNLKFLVDKAPKTD